MLTLILGALLLLAPPESDDESADSSSDSAAKKAGKKSGKKSDKKSDEKSDKKHSVEVEARVVAGGRLVAEAPGIDREGEPVGPPQYSGSFRLRQARVGVDARYRDILRARVSVDFADLLDSPQPGKVLRNAWVNVAIRPAFQIKVGHFKRPYSRLELRNFSDIPFLGRGLYNDLVVESLRWGDRAVGVSLWGKIAPEKPGLHGLRWQISATNNVVSGAAHGVDFHARLTYDPTRWLSLGAGGAYKRVQDPLADEGACRSSWKRDASCRRNVFAGSGDLAITVQRFYMGFEANLAQDWLYAESSPWILGALGYASYDIPVGSRTRLQPVVFGEYIDTNLSYSQSEAARAGGAFNVLWTKRLRIIPQVEFVIPLQPVTAFNRFVARQVYGLWIAVQL